MSPRNLALVLGALVAFTPLAVDMYLASLPTLAQRFAAAPGAVQLTLAAFFVGLSIGQFFFGPIVDRFGRKPPLFVGGAVYVLASFGCAFAPSIEALIALRFVQALGGCVTMVVSRAVVRDLFQPREAARVLSMLMLVMGVAPILAPLLGGHLLIWFGWPSIFLVLGTYGAIILAVAWRWLPETRPAGTAPLSFASALRNYAAVLSDRRFLGYTLGAALPLGGMFAYVAGSPFVFIELYGFGPESYGLLFGANAMGFIGFSQANRWLLGRTTPSRILAVVGLFIAFAGVLHVATALTGFGGIVGLVVSLFFCLTPLGIIMPNATAAAMAAHGERAGTAAAMMGILQFAAGGIAASTVGALHDGTALPMAGLIALCAVSGWLARRLLVGRE
jgi:DHA1 family bicyclomycin/chloramphenicol resistance-like MFS transporter